MAADRKEVYIFSAAKHVEWVSLSIKHLALFHTSIQTVDCVIASPMLEGRKVFKHAADSCGSRLAEVARGNLRLSKAFNRAPRSGASSTADILWYIGSMMACMAILVEEQLFRAQEYIVPMAANHAA